jgi:hypothetical protein
VSRHKPKNQRGVLSAAKAAEFARDIRAYYDKMCPAGGKKRHPIPIEKLRLWARDLRHAVVILRQIDPVYENQHPSRGFPVGMLGGVYKPDCAALSALLLKRAEFLEGLCRSKPKGGRPPFNFSLLFCLWFCLHGLKGIYEMRDPKHDHWKEIGECVVDAFSDVLSKDEIGDVANWARKTYKRYRNFIGAHDDQSREAINFSIRRNLKDKDASQSEKIPKLREPNDPPLGDSLLACWAKEHRPDSKFVATSGA